MTPESTPTKKKRAKGEVVMVTFGRGSAELKRNFDELAQQGGYTKAGFALLLIREGIERRMAAAAEQAH
jgi:predicted DNA-binding protein